MADKRESGSMFGLRTFRTPGYSCPVLSTFGYFVPGTRRVFERVVMVYIIFALDGPPNDVT